MNPNNHVGHYPEKHNEPSSLDKFLCYSSSVAIGSLVASIFVHPNVSAVQEEFSARVGCSDLSMQTSEFASSMLEDEVIVNCRSDLEDSSHDSSSPRHHTLGYITPFKIQVPLLDNDRFKRPTNVMSIRSDLCRSVTYQDKDGENLDHVWPNAMATIAHEYEHLNRVWDETAAECYAAQKLPDYVYNVINVTSEVAVEIARGINEDTLQYLADEYLSDECRDGGSLDTNRHPTFLMPRE